jgi:hypothetical protein
MISEEAVKCSLNDKVSLLAADFSQLKVQKMIEDVHVTSTHLAAITDQHNVILDQMLQDYMLSM